MKKITLFVFLMLLSVSYIFSQEITEGREFWFGLPYCKMKQHEDVRGDYPINIWITSREDTKVTMTIPETEVVKNFNIRANQVTQVVFDDQLMCRESEVITNNGIHLLADKPISVTVYYSYELTGEAFNVLPLEALGKEYVTLNMYLDQIDEMKPPQILIVATEDNTEVVYTPTNPTEKLDTGQPDTITMMKGQTFLILGEMNSDLVQNWNSDITGTYIKANKPIAVFSGHTKGAFPRYYVGYRSNYTDPYGLFSRNILIEQMPPFNLLGTEYITAPIKYIDRPRGLSGVADDFGDLIRFVATQDNTIIYQMRQDGSGLMQISNNLNRGEYLDITNQELAAYYKSNKPVLVGQYGKSWWNEPGMMGIIGKGDEPQNPHKSGQGMLLTITPVNRWINYSFFKSPTAIDNFIYLTFKDEDKENIFYDGQPIDSLWGNAINNIDGTPYAYITTQIQADDHNLEGRNGAKFAGYAYGNWDRTKDGFAYGYPVGMNYAKLCNDSIRVEDTITNGNVKGTAFAIDIDTVDCAGIKDLYFKSGLINYTVSISDFSFNDKNVHFELEVMDKLKYAYAKMYINTVSGSSIEKIYTYQYKFTESPKPPILISPNNNAFNIYYKTELLWHESDSTYSYQIQISKDENFLDIVVDQSEVIDTFFLADFDFQTNFYWRVRALNNAGYSNWSEVWNFKTNESLTYLIEPPKNSIQTFGKINFLWHSIQYADSYILHVSDNVQFNPVTYFINNIIDTTMSLEIDKFTKKLYWKVLPVFDNVQGTWSDIYYFSIKYVIPKLIKPSNDTSNLPIEVVLGCEELSYTDYYKFQVAKDSNFVSFLFGSLQKNNSFHNTFYKDLKYYWRVCAGDGVNFGDWSEVWTFTTGNFSDVKNNIQTSNIFSIFPNPADNELYIEFSNNFANYCEIEIIDMQGNTVSSIKKSNLIYGMNKEQISLEGLPVGIYYCVLKIGGNRYSKMFVKM